MESIQKFQDLLKRLFQFDCTELDFGIYRIMNYKRREIENFIEKDLIKAVEKEFERYKVLGQEELLKKIEEKERKIKEDFGEEILKNGKLEEKYGKTKLVKEYLKLKKQIVQINITENIQNQVFSDLDNFFSRYYEDGDFISKRRYSSKQHRYAIPYGGEEVKLYWANFDQYYVKTGEIFKDYEFNLKGWKFIFRTIFAEVEAGNVKGNRRYFFLSSDNPVKIENKTCFINFEYRSLTDRDSRQYPIKTKEGKAKITGITQDELNPILKDKILDSITPLEPKAILGIASPSARNDSEKTILEKNLYKYTRRITSDFFIHKNLKEFFERELDYFIKTEVLDISNLDERHITRAKVVENIGQRIIEFLSQIEDYQKMLWEKKKFVLKTDYVITIDRIPEEFYQEIFKNKNQLKEWEDLGFGIVLPEFTPRKSGARNDKMRVSLRGMKSRSNLKFPIDTKYFSEDFKERLLEKLGELGNLDDLIDGLLIKSENWQALNLLLGKYKEKIQCIYIDPPFNTGTNEFLYKNKYLDSSWISMMYDRLDLGKKVLKDDGNIYVRIDYHGNHYVRSLMDTVFGEESFLNDLIVARITKKGFGANRYPTANDYLFWYCKTPKYFFELYRKPSKSNKEKWHAMDSMSGGRRTGEPRIILGKLRHPPQGRVWTFSQERIYEMEKKGLIKLNSKGNPIYKVLSQEGKPLDSNWTDIPGYSFSANFATENSEILLHRVILTSCKKGNWVLDYFLGSGTTTAVAQKLGRKWIGVEMGDYFEDIPLKRMKKVLAYDKSGISKDVKDYKGGGFFKYHYLEQYEDTLHNIEFPQEEKGQKLLKLLPEEAKTEYLMNYMLKFETEGSPSLLNLQHFESPFEYKLKIISNGKGEEIENVDLVETFNYLIGLKIKGYHFIKESGRKYVMVFGERNNRNVAVIWRPTKNINLERDKKVIDDGIKDFSADEIFINGDSFVKGYKPIESEFRKLMGV